MIMMNNNNNNKLNLPQSQRFPVIFESISNPKLPLQVAEENTSTLDANARR